MTVYTLEIGKYDGYLDSVYLSLDGAKGDITGPWEERVFEGRRTWSFHDPESPSEWRYITEWSVVR